MTNSTKMADEMDKITRAEERLAEASHVTPDEVNKILEGKPGTSPKSVSELIMACELYAIDLDTVIGSGSKHQLYVIAIRNELDSTIGAWDIPQQHLDDIFWDIFLDGRQLFSTELGDTPPKSALGMSLRFLQARKYVRTQRVPYDLLSPKSNKRGRNGRGGQVAVESDDEFEAPPAQPKKPKGVGFGKMDKPNGVLNAAWKNAVNGCKAKLGDNPLVNNVVQKAKHPSGGVWTVKKIRDEILNNNRCTIGSITGKCGRIGCNFDHSKPVSGAEADQISGIFADAMAAVASEQ